MSVANSISEEETQQTAPTEPAARLWGYLIPFTPGPLWHRIEFSRSKSFYRLGRNHGAANDIVLPSLTISRFHCAISWNGKDDSQSEVIIIDHSSNGTFVQCSLGFYPPALLSVQAQVNGDRIRKGHMAVLRPGDAVSFGTQSSDSRFIYHHNGVDAPLTGVFAEYDIGRELGRGAFAKVFEASHRTTGGHYAVKLINTNRLHQAGNRDRAIREIEILMSLQHPNIVLFQEFFEDETNISLVMEFVPGGNLADYLVKNSALTEPDARCITKQICEAMTYIHQHKIAHRDLKPENVLLTGTIPVIAKIADFGLAKAAGNETFLKTMCGTPYYVAPEVISNSQAGQEYDNSVDSWSTGVIVFQMLTNKLPFREDDVQDILTYIRNRTVEWSVLERVKVGRSCLHFVQQLLMENPTERMSLCDALHHPWLSPI